MRLIAVSAAIIIKNNKILLAQRGRNKSEAYKWEFPGGKLEVNETVEESLKREIKEELGIEIKVGKLLGESIYHYPSGSIRLIAHYASWTSGAMHPIEHEAVVWVTEDQLGDYDFAPADIPLVKKLLQQYNIKGNLQSNQYK